MMRLMPRPGPCCPKKDSLDFAVINPGAQYRVSAQAAFWRVETLRQILLAGESLWDFEINGTDRCNKFDGFVSVWKPALPYFHHVVERGKWFPWDALYFSYLNIGVDLSRRGVMPYGDVIRYFIQKMLSKLALKIPPKIRILIKPLLQTIRVIR